MHQPRQGLASRARSAYRSTLAIALSATAGLLAVAGAEAATSKGGSKPVRTPAAVITVVPSQAKAGSVLTVSGSGLRSRQVASLFLAGRRLSRFRAERGGNWHTRTRVPKRTAPAFYSLLVQASNQRLVAARIRIEARTGSNSSLTERSTGQQVQVTPNRVKAGDRVHVRGSGFSDHQPLGVWFDHRRLERVKSPAGGAFRAVIHLGAKGKPGTHLVSVHFGRLRLDLDLTITRASSHRPPTTTTPTTTTPAPTTSTSSTTTSTPTSTTSTTSTTATTTTSSTTTTTPGPDPVVVAAGDLACSTTDPNYNPGGGVLGATYPQDNCLQQAVSNMVVAASPTAFLTLGDMVNGTASNGYDDPDPPADFMNSYGPTFGRLNSVVYPEVGNGDYGPPATPSYSAAVSYFGTTGLQSRVTSRGGDASNLANFYYSFNLGSWHIIALNAACNVINCGTENTWLQSDLAAHPGVCTLAYWHEPVYNSVTKGLANSAAIGGFWNDLYNAHADIVLNAHGNNHYEDFVQLGPYNPTTSPTEGTADGNGIKEFIASNGGFSHGDASLDSGANHTTDSLTADTSTHAAYDYSSFGALKLTLHPGSYDWQFLNAFPLSNTFSDSGSGTCHSG